MVYWFQGGGERGKRSGDGKRERGEIGGEREESGRERLRADGEGQDEDVGAEVGVAEPEGAARPDPRL